MQISPRRRQRALKVHELRQQGRSLRNIGKQLNISHSTVLADLKLVETHWSELTRQSADDFQLEQYSLLQTRLRMLLKRDLIKEFGRLSAADFVRFYQAHNHELAILLRETRRLSDLLHGRAEFRELEPGDLPTELDFPVEELTAAPRPSKSSKSSKSAKSARSQKPRQPTNTHHGLPKPSKLNHSNHPIPSKTLEIPTPNPQEKIPNQPPPNLTPEQLNQEAETFLRNYTKQDFQAPAAAGG